MILEVCGLLDYRLNPRTCQRISAKDSVVFWLMARLKRLIAKSGGLAIGILPLDFQYKLSGNPNAYEARVCFGDEMIVDEF